MKIGIVLALALSVFAQNSIAFGEEDHGKEDTSKTARPTESKKGTGLSLQEKLSACLAERPGSTSKEGESKDIEKEQDKTWKGPKPKDGQALFEQNCFPCHSTSGTPGPISDWKRAAARAGSDMPPNGKVIPAEDLAKLREFFATKN